jgi:hypothetical protein
MCQFRVFYWACGCVDQGRTPQIYALCQTSCKIRYEELDVNVYDPVICEACELKEGQPVGKKRRRAKTPIGGIRKSKSKQHR